MMRKSLIGLYPGTFDPITYGHLDIIRRSAKLVDHLIIGIAVGHHKSPLFNIHERIALIEEQIQKISEDVGTEISIEAFDGLLVRFAEQKNVSMIFRGLRAISDFEFEFQMVGINSALNSDLEMVFLMADVRHQSIASRLVKEVARLEGDVSHFVPSNVVIALKQKFNS